VDGELVFIRAGFGASALDYERALDLQRELHQRRADGEIPDCCLLLEHQAVYTAGRRTSPIEPDRPARGRPWRASDRG
jgi:lipoyl(octanoyl) transferase